MEGKMACKGVIKLRASGGGEGPTSPTVKKIHTERKGLSRHGERGGKKLIEDRNSTGGHENEMAQIKSQKKKKKDIISVGEGNKRG